MEVQNMKNKKIKVKDIRKLIKGLSDQSNFEIDISDGKIGHRSISTDIRRMNEIELDTYTRHGKTLAYINIINN